MVASHARPCHIEGMTDQARKKRPRDSNELAKLIVDIAIGEEEDHDPPPEGHGKDPAAVSLGRKGGKKGGKVRASRLSAERRSEIARKAALARWRGHTA